LLEILLEFVACYPAVSVLVQIVKVAWLAFDKGSVWQKEFAECESVVIADVDSAEL
jgi:hypothetical protein